MDNESKGIVEVIQSSAPQLPEAVQLSAVKVFSKLLGGAGAYVAAWMKRPIQAVEDGTNAKSIISQRLAQAAAEKAVANPELVEAALVRWLPKEIRKQTNKRAIVDKALEDLATKPAQDNAGPSCIDDVDDDWLNSFERFAEDASSEKMQQLWGRVLSGEITSPGSFRKTTLRFLHELDKQVADDFEWASSYVSEEQLFYPDENAPGNFARLLRLQSAGLITGAGGLVNWQILSDDRGIFTIRSGDIALVCHGAPNKKFDFEAVPLTPVALDLLQIVSNKPPNDLLVRIGDDAVKKGVTGYGIGKAINLQGSGYGVKILKVSSARCR